MDYPSFLNSLNIDYKKSKQAIADEIKKDLTEFLISKSFSILHLLIEAGRLQIENIPWHPEEITEKIVTRLTK
ncbi:MAG: hypothetical protein ACTSQN_10600 [Candidatus Heimdallarchaeota archaeon]